VAEKKAAKKADGEAAVLEKIAAMPVPYRAIGERLHEIITKSVPGLTPRTWYGMPAYAKDGTVVCFFRADKYMTLGFTEDANLTREEGAPHQLVASAYRISTLDAATEAKIGALVKRWRPLRCDRTIELWLDR
jgi:hypothetical protein